MNDQIPLNPLNLSEEEWKKNLTSEEYEVLRHAGTERAFTGEYYNHHEDGMYKCRACGYELFSSDAKFDSGTGWPSFTDATNSENIILREDLAYGMRRTEVLCKNCGSHLGHVFNDGPSEMGGKRFCINSCSLKFDEQK